ncbi:MAG: T9SS type A sorting domain-containing protein [Candidatus Kapabacteria bacterium]|nr:T9SS type A sorting domain-containing protein [Candidatus Kapabacteria bacterium]
MKKIIKTQQPFGSICRCFTCLIMFCIVSPVFSQQLTVSNRKLTVAEGTILKISGGLKFEEKSDLGNMGIIKLSGNLTNNIDGTDDRDEFPERYFGNFFFNGNMEQFIMGSMTTVLSNLTIDNSEGLFLKNNLILDEGLTFINGKLFTDSTGKIIERFYTEPLTITGFDSTKYIVTNKSALVMLSFENSFNNITVPIGSHNFSSTGSYAPITITVTAVNDAPVNIDLFTDFGPSPNENTPVQNAPGIDANKRCNHYWGINKSGTGNLTSYKFEFDLTFTKNTGDVSKYIVKRFDSRNGWISQNSEVIGNTLVVYGTGELGECDFVIGEPVLQKIFLKSGWNLSSSFIIPQQPDLMQNVCNDVKNNMVLAKNGVGKTYIPQFNINQIGKWDYKQAYQVYMTNPDTLIVIGMLSDPINDPIDLAQGWSMAAYLRSTPMDAPLALASIIGENKLLLAKNNKGQTFIPQFGINKIGNLMPGEGYQLYNKSAVQLTYPANEFGKGSSGFRTPNPKYLIPKYEVTGNSAVVLISVTAPDGNEIGIYNQNDELIGSGVVQNNIASVTIWGDDEQTEMIDGAEVNAELRMMNYELKSGWLSDVDILELEDFITGEKVSGLTYSKDAVYFAKAGVIQNSTNISLNVRPNPASDIIEIEFTTHDCQATELSIYTIDGKLISNLSDKLQNMKSNIITHNISNFTSGEYTIILTCENERAMRKVVVVR